MDETLSDQAPLQGRRQRTCPGRRRSSSRTPPTNVRPTSIARRPARAVARPAKTSAAGSTSRAAWRSRPEGVDWQDLRLRPDRRVQPLPRDHGPGLPGPVRGRLQPQRSRGPRRHQRGRAVRRRLRPRTRPEAAPGRPGARARRWRSSVPAPPAWPAPTNFCAASGHACTVFESHSELGGMMRYGIPGYRTPRDVLDGEIQRILDLGVEVRTEHKRRRRCDARGIGSRVRRGLSGPSAPRRARPLPVPGGEAPNCISGIAFLEAFNDGRLKHSAHGAGDRRRRHRHGRGRGGAPARPHRCTPTTEDRPGARGARPDRARRRRGRQARGRRGHRRLPPADRGKMPAAKMEIASTSMQEGVVIRESRDAGRGDPGRERPRGGAQGRRVDWMERQDAQVPRRAPNSKSNAIWSSPRSARSATSPASRISTMAGA